MLSSSFLSFFCPLLFYLLFIIYFIYLFIYFFNKHFPLAGLTTKFNQSMYAQMGAKKNEPLSSLEAKNVRVTEKGGPVTTATPSTLGTEAMRTASPDTSVEEVNPQSKR